VYPDKTLFDIRTATLQTVGPPQEFYKAALMYLAYTKVEDIPTDKKYILATDMALAAITGDDIFNFGEVIATPILSVLKGSPNQWIHDLVFALNQGDIDAFNVIVDSNRDKYSSQPVLVSMHEVIKQKVVLLCLMNIAFERPSHDRQITFSDIAARTRIPLDQASYCALWILSSFSYSLLVDRIHTIGVE
jgi:26S proteasome regulatory subunit N9